MHNEDIIHGDLTTSNIILRNSDINDPVLIDFGLSEYSSLLESKAVDLHVCERAIHSFHPELQFMFNQIIDSYLDNTKCPKKDILSRIDIGVY